MRRRPNRCLILPCDPLSIEEMPVTALRQSVADLCDDPDCCSERLLYAAGLLFAEHGWEGVSTRELTNAAGANLASIAYYFGGKDGLREALVDDVIQRSAVHGTGPVYRALKDDIEESAGDREALAKAVTRFVSRFLQVTLPQGPDEWWVTIINRAMSDRSTFHDRIYERVIAPGFEAVTQLVSVLENKPPQDHRVRLMAIAVLGEVLSFRRSRAIVLHELGWEYFDAEDIERIVKVVSDRILHRLNLADQDSAAAVAG